ncbi:MAG TPA: transglycosylase SLT domain-containing protein [Rhodospirillaceae bacterium]|nr:transglycosylase SLT domain-containing protein [Rhodospirillaceae bacterium]
MLKGRLLLAFVTLATVVFAQCAVAADYGNDRTTQTSVVAALTGASGKVGRQASIPQLLSDADSAHYRAAFDAAEHGQWSTVDREIARLSDPLLLGHLQALRLLSADNPDEAALREWLVRFSDLPEAQDVFDLAKSRQHGQITGLKPPAHQAGTTAARDFGNDEFSIENRVSERSEDHRPMRDVKARFRQAVRHGNFEQATAIFSAAAARQLGDRTDLDELRTILAQALFAAGRDDEALVWGQQAVDGSGDVLPEAHWIVGLARWRSGQHAQSAHNFEAVANHADTSSWLSSAGAYWAARANLAAHHPEVVNHWLQQAASHPRTFYGQLARRSLGQDLQYSWDSRPFTDLDGEVLLRVPAARRALALLQLGDSVRAEEELRHQVEDAGPALTQSMLALANAADMPALAVNLGGLAAARDGRSHDVADYPLPEWRPSNGWSVDRALVLAIARQESGFNPKAKSPCGAVGLMQLMPRTAKALGGSGRLSDPQVSLELGQRYVHRLLTDESIKGNLLFLAASYNSGPGNLVRWQQSIHHDGDALMFLESIPMHETRSFVERVMTNYWAYRNRLGQASPSLDAIAAGDWPIYEGNDGKARATKYGKN